VSLIIGLNGNARAGKDTAADYLVKKYGFVKIAFADELKRTLQRWYNFTDEQLWGDDKEKPDFRYPIPGKGHLTARIAAQVVGTEVGRQIYGNTWVELALRHAELVLSGSHGYEKRRGPYSYSRWSRVLRSPPAGVVISDVRFRNELDGIQGQKDGCVFRIHRKLADTLQVGIAGHASESEQKGIPDSAFDHVIQNNGTLDQLYAELDKALKKVPKGGKLRLVA
jgi:hypothetical protein